MIIECSQCESKVDGEVVGEVESFNPEVDNFPAKAVLVRCGICRGPILGVTDLIQVGSNEYEWTEATRLWPDPEKGPDWNIPDIARNSLMEARVCFKAKAYSACAVMAGRAIEGLCKHHGVKRKALGGGLRELREKGVIDEWIFEWGDELRRYRNIGAHPSDKKIPKEDARDLLDFAIVICDYVFVLREKFARFQERTRARHGSDDK